VIVEFINKLKSINIFKSLHKNKVYNRFLVINLVLLFVIFLVTYALWQYKSDWRCGVLPLIIQAICMLIHAVITIVGSSIQKYRILVIVISNIIVITSILYFVKFLNC